ncbi:MAG: OmpH family outer membrane protein [Flavisolibacter sp.]|nr:OmpH family outer membrane protein [Flavisolibacter sp.]
MNKIRLFIVAVILFVSASHASAQKTGYISIDQIVYLMPEVARIDTLLQRFQTDSIQPQLAVLMQDYNYRDSILNSKDTAKMPVTVRNQHRQELQNITYQLQNWQGFVQQAMQAKENQLMEPVYRKVMNALNQVAKENGYSYVYNAEVLLVAPPGDNLLQPLARKLNIKLPTGATNAAAAANTTPPTNRPPTGNIPKK